MRLAAFASTLGVAVVLAAIAHASSGGITGYSGKNGNTCNRCHNGGVAPGVQLTGPTTLDAGETAPYALVLTTSAPYSGMGAAVSEGQLDAGLNTRLSFDELTHRPVAATIDGGVTYGFTYTAPPFAATVTIYACGNATDGNGNMGSSGDRATATTLVVTVNGPPKPPEDAGSDAAIEDAAPPVDATVRDAEGPVTTRPEASITPPDVATEPDGGCAIGARPDVLSSLLVVLALVSIRRRATRRSGR